MDLAIDARHSRMRPATLARFARPLTWIDILGRDWKNGHGPQGRLAAWWSEAVGLAEDDGLLFWDKKARTWSLTLRGLEAVKAVA